MEMNIIACVSVIFAIVIGFYAIKLNGQKDHELADLAATHRQRDFYLDWLLRTYELHVTDPYVDRPSIVSIKKGLPIVDKTEKRCFHCNAPVDTNHLSTCPWVHVQPLTKTLYDKSRATIDQKSHPFSFGLSIQDDN